MATKKKSSTTNGGAGNGASPRELMLKDLARSGLDRSDADRFRYRALTPDETQELTKTEAHDGYRVPAYEIPYLDTAGDPTGFFRLRLLAKVYTKSDDGKRKELRYWQPDDTVPHAYFTPGVKWTKVMQNTEVTLGFTEGEKKAAKACKEGIITIGLGGVWNFRSKDAHIDFLPELAAVDWLRRRTETYFDGGEADVDKSIKAAEDHLQSRLVARGAYVTTVHLPPGVKLDDYLVDHTADDCRALRRTGLEGWVPPAVATYGESFKPADIPRREWVIVGRYARGEGTALIGPPATNKSMLLLTDAVQIATGRVIFPTDRVTQGEVLLLVGEDSRRDVEARIAAICARYDVRTAALADRFHVVYQTEIDPTKYTLAHMEDDLAVLNQRMFDWLKAFPNLAALFIDPLAAWSHVLENSNDALRVLCLGLRNLAASTKTAVVFDHHINKASMGDPEAHVGNLAAIRGGTHIAADMRWGFTMARLSTATADVYGIPPDDRRLYRRLDALKASHGPEGDEPTLLRIDTTAIANGETVGVLVAVDAPTLRVKGDERRAKEKENFTGLVAAALAKLIDAHGPCSINAAAEWLAVNAPGLYTNRVTKEPLAARSIRSKLAGDVGGGIVEIRLDGAPCRRIVTKLKGTERVVAFADPAAPKAKKGRKNG